MVEFNLLPDVKVDYLKTKRFEHLVITTSFIVGGISLAAFILLFLFVDVAQKVTLNDLSSQIKTSSNQLTSNNNLGKILTVQKQLETLPTLESQTPKVSNIFSFITQLTPVNATISSLAVNFSSGSSNSSTTSSGSSITISGGADSLATVNTFVDTIKYATYNDTTTKKTNVQAFSSVVLSSFSYSTSTTSSPAQYTITFNYDPALFSSDTINLVVPSETTTRSVLNQPILFKSNPK